MKILSNYSSCQFTTLKTNNQAKSVVFLSDISQLFLLPETIKNQPHLVLGQGSNTLFIEDFSGIVIINELKGIHYQEDGNQVLVSVSAGENWHDFVCLMTQKKFHGLENLALIPGTVGASPIQNIGAYGVEVSDCIDSVIVFDLQQQCFKQLSNEQCQFAYRDSLFKKTNNRSKYLVTEVIFKLSKFFHPNLNYSGLNTLPKDISAKNLIKEIIMIRQSKLPDVNDIPNAGSFFKNPIVSKEKYKKITETHSKVPCFNVGFQQVKLSAAWLIESCGFKGYLEDSGVGVYSGHALILINEKKASGKLVWQLVGKIQAEVKLRFDVDLQPEVRIIEKQGEKIL